MSAPLHRYLHFTAVVGMKTLRHTEELNPAAFTAGEDGIARVTRRRSEAPLRRLTLANAYYQCHCTAAAHLTWYHMLSKSAGGNATTKVAGISSFKRASKMYAVKSTSRRYYVRKNARSSRGASCKTSSSCHTIKRMWRSDLFGKSPRRDTFKNFIAALCSEELITDHHRTFEVKGMTSEMRTADDFGPHGLFLIQKHVRVETGRIVETCVEVKTLIERVGSFCVGGINGETGGTDFLLFNGFVRTNGNVVISLLWKSLEQLRPKAFTSR